MAKGNYDDLFEEEYLPEDSHIQDRAERRKQRVQRAHRNLTNKNNEVGECPPVTQEMLKKREKYKNDFIILHADLFPDSTGIRPFGEKQIESIKFGHDVFLGKSNRLLKLEPRGYAKTTRISNEALAAVLLGMQEYVVIICSNQEKAEEILDSIKTELYNNEYLEEIFPGPIACFRQIDDISQKARYQTYGGIRTHLHWGTKTLRFPYVGNAIPNPEYQGADVKDKDGNDIPEFLPEPSSGRFIEIRPMANTKGLHKKIKAGPDAGKVYRPTLFLIDDPQTHDDAKSPTVVANIIRRIKRDALRGGKQTKRASAIMSITPVCPGDVAWHFRQNEQSFDYIEYKMLEKYPDNYDWWMETYAKTYLNYDRTVRGDRTRAAMEAKALLENNWDFAHEGAVVTWDHAFGWEEEPQTEISAVQHAINIILDDGIEDFEYECQCNVEYGMYEEGETMHSPIFHIMGKTLPYPRNRLPQDTSKLVAHIDVNKEILTYAIAVSPPTLRPHIIDYGTFPQQPGIFTKKNVIVPLATLYPNLTDYRDILYRGVRDLSAMLATREYIRQDSYKVPIDAVGVDIRYEESYITRAILESGYRHLVVPCSGTYVGPDDELLHEKPPSTAVNTYENAYVNPNKQRTLDVFHYDTNFFKTEVHRGFNLPDGVHGSLSLYGLSADGTALQEEYHKAVAEHCNSEVPKRELGKKTKRTRIIWTEKTASHQIDNEFFDNIVGCLALFIHEGIEREIDPSSQKKASKEMDMKDFMNQQMNRSLLG